ncbi:MAG: transglutaminase domain-containing protein [Limisphaerales bacterium]
MKPPPFLLAAALLLWGWQTGLMAFAMLMGVVLEATRWIDWRVDFNVKDFNRVADLTSLLAVVGGIYCILTREATNQVMLLFQAMSFASQSQAINSVSQATFVYFHWVPMILFPVVAALAYSGHEQYPWSCFFPLARRRAARAGLTQPLTPGINLDYPYFATVLFSACLVNQRNEWFYFALCGVVGFALWATRPRRFHALVWLVTLVLVIKAGYFGHRGLNQLQSVIENKVASWVINWARRGGDHSEATTAIGKIGQLKLSGKIVMQVEPENGPVPQLLRDATFNRFQSPRWSNIVRKSERQVQAIDDGTTWPLLSKPATNTAVISTFSSRRQAVLSTPPGTSTLHDLPVDEVMTNGQGVIRVNNAPDFLRYRTTFGPGESVQSPPILDDAILGAVDLQVPPAELPAVAQIADELDLLALKRPDRVHAIRRFFSANFKYGSFLPSSLVKVPQGMTPLGFFLLKNRVGHCEYYASATALLLRQAGIPARYAYGWSVQEPDKGVNRFIVRERHAHAWCLYWNSETKTWTDLDTTPSDWVQTENQNASPWEPLTDQWSRAWFAFSKWRWYGATGEWQNYLLFALFGLIILLAWRVLARQRRRRIEAGGSDMPTVVCPGLDSEFYQIETRLDELGLGRRPGEALSDWLARIEPLAKLSVEPLRQLLVLHYRLRFDPQGLCREEREALRGGVNEWLAQTKPV